MDSPHYPTKDEMQYMGDLMRGKRKRDLLVILAFTVAGAIFGAVIGFAGHAGESEPLDVGFILSCVGVVALTFAVITGMLLASLRSIVAICKAWIPARVIVGIVCAVVGLGSRGRCFFGCSIRRPSSCIPSAARWASSSAFYSCFSGCACSFRCTARSRAKTTKSSRPAPSPPTTRRRRRRKGSGDRRREVAPLRDVERQTIRPFGTCEGDKRAGRLSSTRPSAISVSA